MSKHTHTRYTVLNDKFKSVDGADTLPSAIRIIGDRDMSTLGSPTGRKWYVNTGHVMQQYIVTYKDGKQSVALRSEIRIK